MSDHRDDDLIQEESESEVHPPAEGDVDDLHRTEAQGIVVEKVSSDPMETQEMLHVDRYEAVWMRFAAAVLAIFFIAILISAFAVGFQLPGVYERVDPTTLYEAGSAFANPGLRELAPGKYELYIRAQIWSFTPNEVRIPAGSDVTIIATSADVLHGFKLQNTNLNMMVVPGQLSRLSMRFDEPGTYNFVCHEYCGTDHHNMYGRIIVEEPSVLVDSEVEVSTEEDVAGATADEETTGEPEDVAASEGETE